MQGSGRVARVGSVHTPSSLMKTVGDLLKETEAVLINSQSDDFVMADELDWAAVDEFRVLNLGLHADAM